MSDAITIVLADDHALLRRTVRLLLDSQDDIKVVGEAADGRQAVRLVRELRPKVAILDVIMPELDGIEAARRICHLPSPPAIVILTMLITRDVVMRAFRAGSSAYVLKASVADELVHAIHEALADRRFLSSTLDYLEAELNDLFGN